MATGSRYFGISAKLRHCIVSQSYYTALLLGITALHFDFKTRKFSNSKYLNLYANIINVTVVVLAPILQWNISRIENFYGDNLQMQLINSINLNVQSTATIITLVLRWQREFRIKKIVERLVRLEQEYFERVSYPAALIANFDALLYFKYASIWWQSFATVYIVYRYLTHFSIWWYVTFIFSQIVLNTLQAVILHYYMCLLFIGSRFRIINYRLQELFAFLHEINTWTSSRSRNQMEKALAAEVDATNYIHCNLVNVTAKLNNTYKYQILIVLITHVFNNIAFGYYGLMMFYNLLKFSFSYYDFIVGVITYCCLLSDLYFLNLNCSMVESSRDITSGILRQCSKFPHLNVSLERSCELLSLHLMQKRLLINICGMFSLNKKTFIVMIAFTLAQVLILVQNDLATLKNGSEAP